MFLGALYDGRLQLEVTSHRNLAFKVKTASRYVHPLVVVVDLRPLDEIGRALGAGGEGSVCTHWPNLQILVTSDTLSTPKRPTALVPLY